MNDTSYRLRVTQGGRQPPEVWREAWSEFSLKAQRTNLADILVFGISSLETVKRIKPPSWWWFMTTALESNVASYGDRRCRKRISCLSEFGQHCDQL